VARLHRGRGRRDRARGRRSRCAASAPGADAGGALATLRAEARVGAVLCEGGPTLLRRSSARDSWTTCSSRSRRCSAAGDRPADPRRRRRSSRPDACACARSSRRRPPRPALPPVRLPARSAGRRARAGAPLVMGIVNAGPDSFSDSERHDDSSRRSWPRPPARRRRRRPSSTWAPSRGDVVAALRAGSTSASASCRSSRPRRRGRRGARSTRSSPPSPRRPGGRAR
jgi:hypothetical protein